MFRPKPRSKLSSKVRPASGAEPAGSLSSPTRPAPHLMRMPRTALPLTRMK